MRRTWTKHVSAESSCKVPLRQLDDVTLVTQVKPVGNSRFGRVLVRYDFGTHEGWLIFSPGKDGFLTEQIWKCWQILSTEQVGDEVIQELLEMPEDFCCMKAYSVETLPLSEGPDIRIPGWKITDCNGSIATKVNNTLSQKDELHRLPARPTGQSSGQPRRGRQRLEQRQRQS